MGFDRSKYANRKVKQETVVKNTATDATFSERAPMLYMNKLKDGNYKMKIMPPHNLDLDFYQQLSTYILKAEVEKEENGQKVKKIAPKSIFSGEVHSGAARCIIAEYVNFAKAQIESENLEATAKKDKMETLLGEPYSPGNKNPKWGIKANTTFPMYVYVEGAGLDSGNGIYKLNANWTFKSRLQEIESQNQNVDEPIKVDIFTDPETGVCVGLTVDSSQKGKDRYKVDPVLRPIEVKDSFYEYWEKQTPLDESYMNAYTQKDFELAMEGLSNFEEETGFDYLGRDEFMDIAEELSSLYPKKDDNAPAPKKEEKKAEVEKTGLDLIDESDVKEEVDEVAALKAKLAALQEG